MDEIERCVRQEAERIMATVPQCLQKRLRDDAPRDTGELASSISGTLVDPLTAELRQDSSKAPHGNIIDKAKGGRIRPTSAQALRFNVGGRTVFAASVEQSTEHVGWWSDYDFGSAFDRCLQESL